MNLLGVLENGLFALGQVLRFPVMVLLWLCVAGALFLAGGCVVEFVSRQRDRRGFSLQRWMAGGASPGQHDGLPRPLRAFAEELSRVRSGGRCDEAELAHVVLSVEERERRTLVPSRMLVKVGPSLGLLGTLIPMGSSLAALATGNLEAMAGQMVVAFTTTIIGLATGTLAYVVAAVRQGWVNQTIQEQRYLAERLSGDLLAREPRGV